jgi:hypothetical protein
MGEGRREEALDSIGDGEDEDGDAVADAGRITPPGTGASPLGTGGISNSSSAPFTAKRIFVGDLGELGCFDCAELPGMVVDALGGKFARLKFPLEPMKKETKNHQKFIHSPKSHEINQGNSIDDEIEIFFLKKEMRLTL